MAKYKDYMTREQILDLLQYLGATRINDRGNSDNIQYTCTVHKESTPSAGISVDKGVYHCFACHSSGSIPWLVHQSDPDTFKNIRQADKFLRERYGVDFNQVTFDFSRNIKRYGEVEELEHEVEEDKTGERFTLKKSYIAPFRSGIETYTYFFKRGFTRETLEKFKVGRDLSNKSVTVPIYWEDKELCGVIGRFIDPNRPHNFRYILYEEFPKGSIMFPMDFVKFESPTEPLIIVEGLFDSMWLHQEGFSNTLAQLGNEISEAQLEIVYSLCKNKREVILFYDNDKGGKTAVKRFRTLAREKGYNFKIREVNYEVVNTPDRLETEKELKDPQDMEYEDLVKILNNTVARKSITKYS